MSRSNWYRVSQKHSDQFVHELASGVRVGFECLKLLIEKDHLARPVDLGFDRREAQGQEGTQELLQRLFPRAVEVVAVLVHPTSATAFASAPPSPDLTSDGDCFNRCLLQGGVPAEERRISINGRGISEPFCFFGPSASLRSNSTSDVRELECHLMAYPLLAAATRL